MSKNCVKCGNETLFGRMTCSSICLKQVKADHARRVFGHTDPKIRRCRKCFKPFMGSNMFCGPECLRLFRRNLAFHTIACQRQCNVCGKKMFNGSRLTCSEKCAQFKYRFQLRMESVNYDRLQKAKALAANLENERNPPGSLMAAYDFEIKV